MSNGLEKISSLAQAYSRRERFESGQPPGFDHQSGVSRESLKSSNIFSALSCEDNSAISGIGSMGSTPLDVDKHTYRRKNSINTNRSEQYNLGGSSSHRSTNGPRVSGRPSGSTHPGVLQTQQSQEQQNPQPPPSLYFHHRQPPLPVNQTQQ